MPTPSEISSRIVSSLSVAIPDLDTSVGTPIRKILDVVSESIAEAGLDASLIQYQYDIDTKIGADLDAFVAQFGFRRRVSQVATGSQLIQRSTPAPTTITIPVGTQASTSTATPTLVQTVTPAVIPKGSVFVEVPAAAAVGGSAGNVGAGTITRWLGVSGISSVTNPASFSGGNDAESDEQLRSRFKRTLFRSMAGTKDMFLGIAMADPSVSRSRVFGGQERWRESLDIVGGTATPSLVWSRGSIPVTTMETVSPALADGTFPVEVETTYHHYLTNDDVVYLGVTGTGPVSTGRYRVLVTGDKTFGLIGDRGERVAGTSSGIFQSVNPLTKVIRAGNVADEGYLGADLELGEAYPAAAYEIDTDGLVQVSSLDATLVPDGVHDLALYYASQASRNRPLRLSNRISDRGDLWVDGVDAVEAVATVIIDGASTVTSAPDLEGFLRKFGGHRRADGRRSDLSHVMVPLPFGPIVSLPSTVLVGTQEVELDTSMWGSASESPDIRGSSQAAPSLELDLPDVMKTVTTSSNGGGLVVLTTSTSHGFAVGQRVRVEGHSVSAYNGDHYITAITSTTVTIDATSSGSGSGGTVRLYHPVSISYSYNSVPRRIQREIEAWRLVSLDVLVHETKLAPVDVHLVVILASGYTIDSVRSSIETAISNMIDTVEIGGVLQASDIRTAVGQVTGVDAVRFQQKSDFTQISGSVATAGSGLLQLSAVGTSYQPGDTVVVKFGAFGSDSAMHRPFTVLEDLGFGDYLLDAVDDISSSLTCVSTPGYGMIVRSPDSSRALLGGINYDLGAVTDLHLNENEVPVLNSVQLIQRAQNSWIGA